MKLLFVELTKNASQLKGKAIKNEVNKELHLACMNEKDRHSWVHLIYLAKSWCHKI
jgi:hypothetical protein